MNIKNLSRIFLAIALVIISSQFSFAQKKSAAPNKNQLVNQLIDLTILQYPSEELRRPLQETEEKLVESLKTELAKSFTEGIDKDEKLNAEQKARMKEHLPELTDDLSKRFLAKLQIAFSNNVMIKESMREAYLKFSAAELKQIVAFIKTPAGKAYVNFMGELTNSLTDKAKGEPVPPTQYEAKIERFSKTPAGDKFMSAFMGDITKIFFDKVSSFLENYTNSLDKKEFEAVIADYKNKYSK